MSASRAVRAALTAIIFFAASCAGSSETGNAVDPTGEPPPTSTVAPPTTSEQADPPEPTATAQPDPTATPTSVPPPTPEPTAVIVATEPSGEFQCESQAMREVLDDPELSASLEPLLGDGVPGMVVATATSRGIVRVGSAGVRSVGGDDGFLAADRVHLGSDTKAMTGALLALLAEDGVIELTTPVSEIWPDADAGWQGVTLLDLLRHRGGAEDSLARDQSELWGQLWRSSIAAHSGTNEQRASAALEARAAFADSLMSTAPSEQVGSYTYSNSGYMLVGAALETQLGAPWESLMCDYLFRPLRMDGCGFGAPPTPGPTGHSGIAGALTASDPNGTGSDNPAALGPAGTVYCPVADWTRFLSWVLRGAQGVDDLLPSEAWELLLAPDGSYAGGWGVTTRPGLEGTLFTHAGSNTMWFAIAWLAPDEDRAFVAVSNAATIEAQQATDTAIGLLIESD